MYEKATDIASPEYLAKYMMNDQEFLAHCYAKLVELADREGIEVSEIRARLREIKTGN